MKVFLIGIPLLSSKIRVSLKEIIIMGVEFLWSYKYQTQRYCTIIYFNNLLNINWILQYFFFINKKVSLIKKKKKKKEQVGDAIGQISLYLHYILQ